MQDQLLLHFGGIPWLGGDCWGRLWFRGGSGLSLGRGAVLMAVLCSPLGCSRAPCCLHELGILLGLHLPPLLSLPFSPISLPFLVCVTQASFPLLEFSFFFSSHHFHACVFVCLSFPSHSFSPHFSPPKVPRACVSLSFLHSTPKVMPPILWCCPMMSEADVGGMWQ